MFHQRLYDAVYMPAHLSYNSRGVSFPNKKWRIQQWSDGVTAIKPGTPPGLLGECVLPGSQLPTCTVHISILGVKDGSSLVETVDSKTSMMNVRNGFSPSELKVFKIPALAKIFQRYWHSYTWNMSPEWSVVTRLGQGKGWVPQHSGASQRHCKDGACLREVISLSGYPGTHGTENWDFNDLKEQVGSLCLLQIGICLVDIHTRCKRT